MLLFVDHAYNLRATRSGTGKKNLDRTSVSVVKNSVRKVWMRTPRALWHSLKSPKSAMRLYPQRRCARFDARSLSPYFEIGGETAIANKQAYMDFC